MFSQKTNPNPFYTTDTASLGNNFMDDNQQGSKATQLFAASTDGHLFRTVQDSTQVLPPHVKKLDMGSAEATGSNPLPLESRITKAAQDNALPIFFAGARPKPQPEESSLHTEKRPSLLPDTTPLQQSDISTESKSSLLADDSNNKTDDLRTIKIFGFPSSLTNMILDHFEKYGRIEQSRSTPGSWLIIRYINPSSAAAALKSNGTVLADNFMIGVTMATDINQTPTRIVPAETNTIVGLGSGKTGISTMGLNTINPTGPARIPQTTGWLGLLKDALFSW